MPDTMFFNMLLNIGLLVLIATMLTNVSIVRSMFLEDKQTIRSRVALAVLFGLISILSTYTGVRTQGAIVNTRVIGVLTAGLLGGPWVGIGSALIGGGHRYLFDIGGFTAISCAISTIMEGVLGAAFSKKFKAGEIHSPGIFLITAMAEIGQMAIILLLARPFDAAVALVRQIALPMILMNALGMVIFIGVFNRIFVEEESLFGEKMRMALAIAEKCLPHLRKGLHSVEDMDAAVEIIYRSTDCAAIFITDTREILAMAGESGYHVLRRQAFLPPVWDSMQYGKTAVRTYTQDGDTEYRMLKNHVVIAAPLIEMDKPVGSLVMLVKKRWQGFKFNQKFVSELARLFSTQLELSDLEYQKRLRRKAELKALQFQVNPHFLYNALNTISSVCRENPDRARDLILTLSSYYRQTLENEQYMIRLSTELYHVMSYLKLEQARFEEKLSVEFAVEDDLDCMVPSFILQPLVENAVRYGVDEHGKRSVTISARSREGMAEIAVSDRGPGIPQEVIEDLMSGQGTGVGLNNVHRRLQSIYGEVGGLQITSSAEGARVSFRIPLAADMILPFEGTPGSETKGEAV